MIRLDLRTLVLPLLHVIVSNGINMRPVLALVDSGATDCIFSASFGEALGIDVRSGRSHEFQAYDRQTSKGYTHNVKLQVPGFLHWIDIDAVFIDSEVMPILGQQGFFESYQIIFERFKRQFEINTKTDAIIRNKRGYGRGR